MAGRKKLNRKYLHARVDPDTPEALKNMAKELGFVYTNNDGKLDGSTGKLLDAIAKSDFLIPILQQIFSKSSLHI
ncbi:MAG: hypothetical protein HEQ35_09510 [Gloeotrichia echinulata IR180]|jgi:hypothetical protein|nr:hypothetical protein [Gloeotrichia echinulata DEX184]MCM0589482.1 hypothetical protein [Gloeotrichia echinulata DEX184]